MSHIIESPVMIGNLVYFKSRGNVLEYEITSINIDKYGMKFEAYCEEQYHGLTIPKEWIGETVFLNKEDAIAHETTQTKHNSKNR